MGDLISEHGSIPSYSTSTPESFNDSSNANSGWLSWLSLLAVIGIAGAVYLATMAPTVFTLDSAEFATAAYGLGIVHSPGYSVYLLIAHAATYLPVGDIAYRVNLLSAVYTVITSAMLTIYLSKKVGIWPAVLASLSLAFSYYVWSLSVVAEVYTMQMGLFLLLIILAEKYAFSSKPFHLNLLAFFTGIACANNPITVLWWPGLIYFVWQQHERLTLKRLIIALGWGVIGLLPILYLPVRSYAQPTFTNVGLFNELGEFVPVSLASWEGLVWYLSGQEFESLYFGYSLFGTAVEGIKLLNQLIAAFLGIGFPLGVWGALELWQTRRSYLIGLIILITPYVLFFVTYAAIDKETMFLPLYLLWAILMGIGIKAANEAWLSFRNNKRQVVSLYWVGLLLPVALLLSNWTFVDLSDATGFADDGRQRLAEAAPNALFVSRWGESAVLSYFQIVESTRPDVSVVNSVFISTPDTVTLINHALAEERPVYATFNDDRLLLYFEFEEIEFGYVVSKRVKSRP
ncbi:MAG: DUF2723 domain-containing protein [Chloroflexota bacterium]